MSEYIIELPDSGAADEFVTKMGVDDCRIYGYRLTGEIVRCRDCKYWMDYEHEFEPNLGYCREFDREEVRDNDFCSFGERREQ